MDDRVCDARFAPVRRAVSDGSFESCFLLVRQLVRHFFDLSRGNRRADRRALPASAKNLRDRPRQNFRNESGSAGHFRGFREMAFKDCQSDFVIN